MTNLQTMNDDDPLAGVIADLKKAVGELDVSIKKLQNKRKLLVRKVAVLEAEEE